MILPSLSPAGLHYGYPLAFLLKELNGFLQNDTSLLTKLKCTEE